VWPRLSRRNPHEARSRTPDEAAAPWTGSGYTKLQCWRLVEYATVVYVDADAVVLEPIDELFELGVVFAAAPDVFLSSRSPSLTEHRPRL